MAKVLPQKSDRLNRPSKLFETVWRKLDDYQCEAVELALEIKTLAVLFDQGTGKTFVAGGVMERLLSEATDTFAGVLIVPLTNKTTTWRKFIETHLPSLKIFEQAEEFVTYSGPKVILLHLDQFATRSAKKLVGKLRKHRYTCMIVDEGQRMKERSSATSRNIAKLRYCTTRKLLLTGTPMDKEPIDLWAQFRWLRPNLLGTRWKDFEHEFIEPLDEESQEKLKGARIGSFKYQLLMKKIMIARGKRKFDMTKLPQFLDRISPWCTRVTQEDLGWDKAVYHKVPVILGVRQRKIYDDFERHLVAKLNKITITAPLKVTRLEKMRQVCGGYLIDENKNVHVVGYAKIDRLMKLISEHVSKSPIAVFCKYTAEVDAIVERIERTTGLIVAKLSGKVKHKDRDEIKRLFQAGGIDVIVCQIKTGGVGIDLFRSYIGIMYSPIYSFIDFDQAIKRLKRRGQTKQVHIFLLFAEDTIDEDAFSAIVKKRNVNEHVLKGIKERNRQWLTRNTASKIWRSPSVFSKQQLARTSETPASRNRAAHTNGRRANSKQR